MKLHIRHIALVFVLLLVGSIVNEAWGKITYHILSLPMTTYQRDGENNIEGSTISAYRTNVRVEVLRCYGNDQFVGLPTEYKSPLIADGDYHYYTADKIIRTGPNQLYGYNNTTYYFYKIDGTADNADNPSNYTAVGTEMVGNVDIYVTYDYDPASSPIDLSATLDRSTGLLSASKEYNIHLKDRMVVLNQNRQNRPGAVLDGYYTPEQLASDEFSWIVKEGLNNTAGWRFFGFKFGGNDPYNVTIYTSYDKETTFRGTGQNNFSTNDVKDREKYLQKDVFKEYRGSSFFRLMSGAEMNDKNMWFSSDADIQWQDGGSRDAGVRKVVPGYFKGPNDNKNNLYEMSPIFNSFAILNHKSGEGYAFAGSKMNTGTNNWQPKANGQIQFMDYGASGNNITIVYKPEANVMKVDVYEVKKYIFRVKTLFGSNIDAEFEWSDYAKDNDITVDMVPASLKRKYVGFTGFYADAAHNTPVTTFAEAQTRCTTDANGNSIIYVDYNVTENIPFTAMPTNVSYAATTIKWYELTDKDDDLNNKKIQSNNESGTGFRFSNNGASGTYSKEGEFAFIGDPYELRIINRKLSEDNSGNRYVGCTNNNINNFLDHSNDSTLANFKWEIPYDETTGSFLLKKFRGDGYWWWNTLGTNGVKWNSVSTYIKVLEIGQLDYTFNIVDRAGNIAIKATAKATPFTSLAGNVEFSMIPSAIRSPFLADETVTFHSTKDGVELTEMPGTAGDIFVKYTCDRLLSKSINLSSGQQFNVKLNDQYIYWNGTKILSDASINTSEDSKLTNPNYLWRLEGADPYAMKIRNNGKNEYVKVASWANEQTLGFDATISNGSPFIAMMGNYSGVYEVLAAVGTTDSDDDGNSDIYHIGRASSDNSDVMIYRGDTYAHGSDEVRFVLEGTTVVNYHLIDKNGDEIFEDEIKSKNSRLSLPPEYVSPLVANYYYYSTKAEALSYRSYGTVGTRISEASEDSDTDNAVWVVYDINDLVEYNVGNKMYRLKFENGESFHQEDGHDHMNATKQKAIYPYCNGDCSFFVYGKEQLDEQLGGAASTRTRWAWYLESENKDPYHVKIVSRQQEKDASQINQRIYFRTYVANYDNANHVVTGTTTPGVTEIPGTEYMVLGLKNQYKLTTLDKINDGSTNARRTVNSFEQYWKTWETITDGVGKKDSNNNNPNIDADGNITVDLSFSAPVSDATREEVLNGLHTYTAWAKSRPIQKKSASKRFANETHYYHTVNMGTGTFDFEEMEIIPVLVLLDQHGWEIMRKPLPTGTDDPDKAAKYDAIRPYNSPMVKEYKFWSKPTKATGHHYYKVANAITKSASSNEPYTSTDLTQLPPITAKNVRDNFGDLNDQYVTYTVKDEYLVNDMTFLVQQGENFAKTTDGLAITTESVGTGLAAKIASGEITDQMQWKLHRNEAIETEMGIGGDTYDTGYKLSDGFDPYNVRFENAYDSYAGKYFTSDATNAVLEEGSTVSTTNGSTGVTLTDGAVIFTDPTYDNSTLQVTNSTFMVVQDANGNMQLMPRFDQSRRVTGLNTLATATTAPANDQTGNQTTFLIRPRIHEYIIIDNQGDESLRYRLAGEDYPSIPDHFRSPLARDFEFYKTANTGSGHDYDVNGFSGIISNSLAAENLVYTNNVAQVYVRYKYDETVDADRDNLLLGIWLTMTLGGANQWVEYYGTLNTDGSGIYTDTKPATSGEGTLLKDARQWHWKFLKSPCVSTSEYYTAPDPYRVELFNRQANDGSDENMRTPISVGGINRFAILNHSDNDGGYALAAAGGKNYTYNFLNGSEVTAPSAKAASLVSEGRFAASGTISDNAKITVLNDISHTYTYMVLTNEKKFAVRDEQIGTTEHPIIPETIQSPLLNEEDYLYYGTATQTGGVYEIDENSQVDKLFGLYDDILYVRYNYDSTTSPFRVPNERNAEGSTEDTVDVGDGSNNSPLDITGKLGYNIIWLNDKMMYNNSGSVGYKTDQKLSGAAVDEWMFEGGDPYALIIKSKYENEETKYYIDGNAALANSPSQTFMLLKKENYDFGMLAKTGAGGYRLTGYGEGLTVENADPIQYFIFALATNDLIYTLINPISGESTYILYYRTEVNGTESSIDIPVTTKRNNRGSNIYSLHAGKVSLGDKLEAPVSMTRPYCSYTYYINHIENPSTGGHILNKYEGYRCEDLPNDVEFISQDVYVDVVYDYNTDDVFNNQNDYKANPEFRFNNTNDATTTRWYTLETRSATPALMNFKLTGEAVGAADGRDLHYTNDYLWTVEGDPYGFYIHNRYAAKNAGNWNYVVTTSNAPAADATLIMSTTQTYGIYEMTPTSTDGYFRLHPINTSGMYVYNNAGVPTLSTTSPLDWKFALNEAQLAPYKERAGYVGGLKTTAVEAYDAATLTGKQTIVYTNSNIQPYANGYYRLKNIPGAAGISQVRFLSGYRNNKELTGTASSPVPLHFYEQKGVTNAIFNDLGTNNTNYTRIEGLWGEVPVPAPEYDPASIFYFSSASSPSPVTTQDLNVYQGKMDASSSTSFTIEDLGGAVVALHDGNATIGSRNYLHYNQASAIYDAKYGTGVELADYSKWCMAPANEDGLKLALNNGGDNYYYATFYVPFDVTITSTEAEAYVCTAWDTQVIHPTSVGKNIKAETPVIIRSTSSNDVTMTLDGSAAAEPESCVFSGNYLAQKLTPVIDNDVYSFGLALTGTISKEENYNTTGEIKAVNAGKEAKGVGFYINATPNREVDPEKGLWKRNNLYILANKIYYRAGGDGAREKTRGVDFIPVIFDDEGGEEPDIQNHSDRIVGDGCIYDLAGRKVATEQQVEDGSWRSILSPGIYIINGKKFSLSRGDRSRRF